MMTESQMIAREHAKHSDKLRRDLRKINRTGRAGRRTIDTLLVNGLIVLSGPIPGVSEYNCYRLTERGEAELLRLES